MNVKTLSWLAGAACATLSASVFAQSVEVRISGASALQTSIQKAVAEICDPTKPLADRNLYRSATGTAYTCTARTTILSPARQVVIRKRDAGGSGLGVMNLNVAANTLGFTGTTTGCVASTSDTDIDAGTPGIQVDLDPTAAELRFNAFSGCADVTLPVMYGVSDVEPTLFASQGAVNNVTGTPLLAQVFGLAVNDKLYRKLQGVQGISESGAAFDPANAPSIEAAQFRSIAVGNYQDWTQIDAGITAAPTGTTAIKVCRRVATSGTQATFNARLLENPCGAGALTFLTNVSDATNLNDANAGFLGKTDAFTVVMNSGAGNVDNCMTLADNQDELAIGLLGTERVAGASPSDDPDGVADKWHFVKLDGVYPSVANTVAGKYDLYAEASWNRGTTITYTADQETVANFMITTMGSPDTITNAGLLGVAALPDNGFDPTTQSPVLKGGRGGNTCRPTTFLY
ncbi:MAG: hypothetical protein U1F52_01915 [Burkholderiales bacterium]